MAQPKATSALYCSHHRLLLLLAVVNAFAFLLSADVRLIDFDNAAEWLGIALLHRFPDAVIQVPRGFVAADAEIALQLLRGDALLRVQDQADGMEPHYERQMRVGEQRTQKPSARTADGRSSQGIGRTRAACF